MACLLPMLRARGEAEDLRVEFWSSSKRSTPVAAVGARERRSENQQMREDGTL